MMERRGMASKKFKARNSYSGNDLFWEFVIPTFWTKDIKIVPNSTILRWSGYDDEYWWENVGNKPSQQSDKAGNIWELDYVTNEVTLVKKAKWIRL
ncbi:hypothetical protein DSECCO2_197580 [anaerobic digester metagenome]